MKHYVKKVVPTNIKKSLQHIFFSILLSSSFNKYGLRMSASILPFILNGGKDFSSTISMAIKYTKCPISEMKKKKRKREGNLDKTLRLIILLSEYTLNYSYRNRTATYN